MFIEDDNNNITLDGQIVVEYYSRNTSDFARFVTDLHTAVRAYKTSSIQNWDGTVFDVDDFISYERRRILESRCLTYEKRITELEAAHEDVNKWKASYTRMMGERDYERGENRYIVERNKELEAKIVDWDE